MSDTVERKKLRISREKAKVGMSVAEDVFTESGIVLIGVGTLLNSRFIYQLQQYNIKSIVIYEDSKYVTQKPFTKKRARQITKRLSIDVSDRKFQNFSAAYDSQVNRVKSCIDSMFKGNDVDISTLYSASVEVLSGLGHKNDLLVYLSALENANSMVHEHCVRVSLLASLFGSWLNLSAEEVRDLTVAGMLHDIGMLQVPLNIIEKPDKLSSEEYVAIKEHTVAGARILNNKGLKRDIIDAVLSHHERIDGSGYPSGKCGDAISKYAKIIAIVDVYDAMISKRSQREAYCPFYVIKHLERNYLGQLDTQALLVFLENIATTYRNAAVELSNGQYGKIFYINKTNISRPIVTLMPDNGVLDLAYTPGIEIARII